MKEVILYGNIPTAKKAAIAEEFLQTGRKVIFRPISEFHEIREQGKPFYYPMQHMACAKREAKDLLQHMDVPGQSLPDTHHVQSVSGYPYGKCAPGIDIKGIHSISGRIKTR